VETEAQLALLKELKCDQTQGYLLGRPMGVSDFVALMQPQARQQAVDNVSKEPDLPVGIG
jgi:EAL domain-containing protein (putative c-di-GMP-specific phosphodiesterase class I)